MSEFVFFYGTLMTPFNRPGRQRVDGDMSFVGLGSFARPFSTSASIPPLSPPTMAASSGAKCIEMHRFAKVLAALDEIEGYRPNEPEQSLYPRAHRCQPRLRTRGKGLGVLLQRAAGSRAAHRVGRLPRAPEDQGASRNPQGAPCRIPSRPMTVVTTDKRDSERIDLLGLLQGEVKIVPADSGPPDEPRRDASRNALRASARLAPRIPPDNR